MNIKREKIVKNEREGSRDGKPKRVKIEKVNIKREKIDTVVKV